MTLTGKLRRGRAVTVAMTSSLVVAGWVAVGPASAADTQPPTQPGAITVSNVTASSVQLKWGKSTDDTGIEGYRVYRGPASAADGDLSLIETTDAINSFPATTLRSSYAYKFGVTAIDSADNQSPMRTTTVTTLANTDTTVPAAPSNASLSLVVFSSSRIDVIYGASTSNDVAYYLIYRNGTLVGTVEKPYGNHYSDNGLAPSTTYSYDVVAVDSAGNMSAPTAVKSATTLAVGVPKIARGPYLSNMTGTSAVISWYTNIATTAVVSIAGQQVTDSAGSVQHHTVTITGLSAGTNYPYTVTSGTATGSGTLRTAATPGSTFSFAAIGDFGGGSAGETQNAINIGSSGTQFIQTLGDDIYPSAGLPDPDFNTTYSDFDGRFFKPFGAVVKSQAFMPANGNKEYYGDGEFWQTFPMLGTNHSWYSYDWGDAHILVLDSEVPFETGTPQYQFAQADLAAHQSAAWRIVALQRPPYSSTTADSSSKPVQQYLVPLFQQDNVNLVLSGNSHNYERSYPLVNGSAVTSGGITYIVSGGGGNGFNVFTSAFPQPAYSAYRESSWYEFTKVTVSPTVIKTEAIRADTNQVFDTTTIAKPGADLTAPSIPGGVNTSTSGNLGEIDLSWAASTDDVGVTGYKVYRDGATKAVATVTSGTSYADTGLTAGSTHTYAVSAFDAAGNESAVSSPAVSGVAGTGRTVTVAATDDATISQATGNTGTNYGGLSTLTVDADQNINDFLVRFTVPANCTPTAASLTMTVGASSTSGSNRGGSFYAAPGTWAEGTVTAANAPPTTGSPVIQTAVTANTAYPLDVTSLLPAGATGGSIVSLRATTTSTDAAIYVSRNASNGATAGPQLQLTCGSADSTAPSVPTGVRAATGPAGEIDLSWAASTDNVAVTGYRVYRDGAPTAISTTTATSYADTGLATASTHTYAVTAIDAAGNESGKSSPVASGVAGSSVKTVAASDDATISNLSGSTGTNYGSLPTLTVDKDENVNDFLVKFTVPAGCNPTAATLALTTGTAGNSGSSHGGSFYAAPGTWAEGTVTAANAPAITGSPVIQTAVTANTTYTLNVTSLLPAGATGGSTVSLRATTTSTDSAIYVSKDAPTNGATAGPQLTLTC